MFEDVMSDEALPNVASCYFASDGVLMKKGTDPKMSSEDDWIRVFQKVVPEVYWSDILYLAHDHSVCPLGYQENFGLCVKAFFSGLL